jgi:uncharacterized DUF497 family protein
MNPYMNNRNVLMLPHPVRADAALGQSAEQLMFASTGMMGAIQPHLTQGTFTIRIISARAATAAERRHYEQG